jgi:molybdate transport system substrate-binding protein
VKPSLRLLALASLVLSFASGVRAQTEVTLLAPNPYRRTLDKLVAGFEMKTGYKLKVTLGRGLGTRQQVARGEIYDVNILLPPYPEALASGNIDPRSATTIANLVLAVGVKKGAAKPDISTPEKLKQALLSASGVAFVDPMVGSDGFSTQEALQKMGLLEQLAPKIKHAQTATAVSQLVAKGDADLCIFYRNEMAENANVDVVAALPRQFAEPGPIVAFISTKVHDAKAAKALIDYLSSPDAQAFYEKEGFERAR